MLKQRIVFTTRRSAVIRGLASVASNQATSLGSSAAPPPRVPKKEGTIQDLFTSLTAEFKQLPERFVAIKKDIFHAKLTKSWREVLEELQNVTEDIATRGADVSNWIFTFSCFQTV